MTLFNVTPTALEISLVSGILAYSFGPAHAAAALATVGAYVGFTVQYSSARIPIRKRMNAADAAVSGHAIDTLVNYESVKYFGAEAHEARGAGRVVAPQRLHGGGLQEPGGGGDAEGRAQHHGGEGGGVQGVQADPVQQQVGVEIETCRVINNRLLTPEGSK